MFKKRTIAGIAMISLLLTMLLPTYTLALDTKRTLNNSFSETVKIGGQNIEMEYQIENGTISTVILGGIVFQRIGNEIFADNIKIATIENEDLPEIEPRTGWYYTEDCPLGTADDYTKYISSKNRNLVFEQKIVYFSELTLVGAISLALGNISGLGAVAAVLGEALYNTAMVDREFGESDRTYCTEEIYGHKQLANIYRRNDFTFYKDADHTELVDDAYGTAYSWWG